MVTEALRRAQQIAMVNPIYAPLDRDIDCIKEGDNMADATVLYEVLIIDSREVDDDEAVTEVYVRAKSREDARLLAILRTEQGESDISFLDFAVKAIENVKPVVASEDGE